MSVENARCRIIYCASICGEKEREDENHYRGKKAKKKKEGGAEWDGESATVFTTLPACAQSLLRKTHRQLAILAASTQGSWVSGNRKDLALCIIMYL